jgi:hypothetical protein
VSSKDRKSKGIRWDIFICRVTAQTVHILHTLLISNVVRSATENNMYVSVHHEVEYVCEQTSVLRTANYLLFSHRYGRYGSVRVQREM